VRARLTIVVATPAPPASRNGNRVTALRWAAILRGLGHRVRVVEPEDDAAGDLLIALHARRAHPAIARWPLAAPVIVAMTGTDLHEDLPRGDAAARASLERAARVVLLQPLAAAALPARHRPRARVILQSACAPPDAPPRAADRLDVCVVGHLRAVKDPLRTALAARLLPASSTIHVTHIGAALDDALADAARFEAQTNPRYRWLGPLPRGETLRRIAASHVLSLTSHAEGGANVIPEALVCGALVVTAHIPGALGNLGDDYPATFPPGDTAALAALLARVERDAPFRAELEARRAALAPRFSRDAERDAWRALLSELGG
jgi:putative glycosyltransferase (TIGR04348 family)